MNNTKYPWMTPERIAYLRKRLAQVYNAGNGGDNVFTDGEEIYASYSDNAIIEEVLNGNNDHILDKLDYDVETGEDLKD